MLVVSDTSPISNLHVIGRLHLLHDLFGTIVLPGAVLLELSKLTDFGYDISAIENAPWISVQSATDSLEVSRLAKQLDLGESEAIVLAQELGAAFLMIDERRGWKIANAMGLKTIGVLGVLLKAKSEGLIPVISPVLDDLESIAGFWMNESLRKEVLLQAGELI
jgi:predicted nucleic acid-binding protein